MAIKAEALEPPQLKTTLGRLLSSFSGQRKQKHLKKIIKMNAAVFKVACSGGQASEQSENT